MKNRPGKEELLWKIEMLKKNCFNNKLAFGSCATCAIRNKCSIELAELRRLVRQGEKE